MFEIVKITDYFRNRYKKLILYKLPYLKKKSVSVNINYTQQNVILFSLIFT